jgi:hypothetical protein
MKQTTGIRCVDAGYAGGDTAYKRFLSLSERKNISLDELKSYIGKLPEKDILALTRRGVIGIGDLALWVDAGLVEVEVYIAALGWGWENLLNDCIA